MDIVELDEEHHSCVCGGGDVDIVKDLVGAAAAAMAAVVATPLLGDNIGAVRFVSVKFVIFRVGEDARRMG